MLNVVIGLRAARQGPITGKVVGPLNLSLGVRALLVIVCALFSVIVAIVAGYMSHKPGARKRDAVLYGGGAFVGSLTLCLAVLGSLGVLSSPGAQ
ncbi:hypothetical protein [Streptomyces mirabilis]|uniref:hypothetical protein n=1 Tax=Streptomyces mirabilis TaxID=68239 RepID=UPI00331E2FC8